MGEAKRKKDLGIKPTKKKTALDPKWVTWVISACIGPNLTFLRMGDINGAEELTRILEGMLNSMWETWESDDELFVKTAITEIVNLYSTFVNARALFYLQGGMPKPPSIIVPSNQNLQ